MKVRRAREVSRGSALTLIIKSSFAVFRQFIGVDNPDSSGKNQTCRIAERHTITVNLALALQQQYYFQPHFRHWIVINRPLFVNKKTLVFIQ